MDNKQQEAADQFRREADVLIGGMRKAQFIFRSGYYNGGPTNEERQVAQDVWDNNYAAMVQLSSQLFRVVGGSIAFEILTQEIGGMEKKWGGPARNLLFQEYEFIQGILVAATENGAK